MRRSLLALFVFGSSCVPHEAYVGVEYVPPDYAYYPHTFRLHSPDLSDRRDRAGLLQVSLREGPVEGELDACSTGLACHGWADVRVMKLCSSSDRALVRRLAKGQCSSLGGELHAARVHSAFDAVAALLTPLVATIRSVYKPRGLTAWANSV